MTLLAAVGAVTLIMLGARAGSSVWGDLVDPPSEKIGE